MVVGGLRGVVVGWAVFVVGHQRFKASSVTDGVLEVDSENWEARVGSAGLAMVEFFAPWCEHCKSLKAEYAAAARMTPEVTWARVDATAETELASAHGIRGYPHIKLYRRGVFGQDYEGPNEAQALSRWARRKALPAVTQLRNWTEARAFFADDDRDGDATVRAVAACGEDKVAAWTATLEAAARYVDDEEVRMGVATDPELAGGGTAMGLYVHAPNWFEVEGVFAPNSDVPLEDDMLLEDAFVLATDEPPEVEVIVRAVEGRTAPAVVVYDAAVADSIFRRGPAVHATFFIDPAESTSRAVLTAFEAASKKNRDRVRHVVVPASEQRVLEHFDVDVSELPALALIDLRGKRPRRDQSSSSGATAAGDDGPAAAGRPSSRSDDENDAVPADSAQTRTYRFEAGAFGDLADPASILAFEAALLDHDPPLIQPYLRSEPFGALPADLSTAMSAARTGAVVPLVGRSFRAVVQAPDRDADVLVAFLAPWCAHSLALAAPLETLALALKDVASVLVATLDATKNDVLVPGLAIAGFPTIAFFPATKDPNHTPFHLFSGPRDHASLVAFLQAHATHAVHLSPRGSDL